MKYVVSIVLLVACIYFVTILVSDYLISSRDIADIAMGRVPGVPGTGYPRAEQFNLYFEKLAQLSGLESVPNKFTTCSYYIQSDVDENFEAVIKAFEKKQQKQWYWRWIRE